MNYTNKEFLEVIQKRFQNSYSFGIHNINLKCYESVQKKDQRYSIATNAITTIEIANNILQKGLFVYERDRGLSSTVLFINNENNGLNPDNEDILNYAFQEKEDLVENKIVNIFIAIPNLLLLDHKEYSVGHFSPIENKFLFNEHLPSEFIYGYYTKNVFFTPHSFYPITYEKNLEFTLNRNHISLKTDKEQEEIIMKNKINLKRRSSYEKFEIK